MKEKKKKQKNANEFPGMGGNMLLGFLGGGLSIWVCTWAKKGGCEMGKSGMGFDREKRG